jgi:hypothetical protein
MAFQNATEATIDAIFQKMLEIEFHRLNGRWPSPEEKRAVRIREAKRKGKAA